MPGSFLDTNVLVYLAGSDETKAQRAEALLGAGGTISVQVLNELANVIRRKHGFFWNEVAAFLGTIRQLLQVVAVDEVVHDEGLRIARRHQLSLYDGMIAGAARQANCDLLWSEDMHHGLVIDGLLEVRNPFV